MWYYKNNNKKMKIKENIERIKSFLFSLLVLLFCVHRGMTTETSFTFDPASFSLSGKTQVWKEMESPARNTTSVEQRTKNTGNIKANLHNKEMVVHANPIGRIVLAGVLGAGLGLLAGILLSLLFGCCILKCRRGAKLTFDRKHNTYRSADVIDSGV